MVKRSGTGDQVNGSIRQGKLFRGSLVDDGAGGLAARLGYHSPGGILSQLIYCSQLYYNEIELPGGYTSEPDEYIPVGRISLVTGGRAKMIGGIRIPTPQASV